MKKSLTLMLALFVVLAGMWSLRIPNSYIHAKASDSAPADIMATVDFSSNAFPAIIPKFGLNEENWDVKNKDNLQSMKVASESGSSITSGLYEINPLVQNGKVLDEKDKEKLRNKEGSTIGPDQTFYKDDERNVHIRLNQNLLDLRKQVGDNGMVNFLQFAGTPDIFKTDPDATYSGNGNFYPLPKEGSKEMTDFAQSVADFAHKLTFTDHVPTIWSFWQEPSHTVDYSLSIDDQLKWYMNFYKQVAPLIQKEDPDAMFAGIQLNAANGGSLSNKINGATYEDFAGIVNNIEKKDNIRLPFDYITNQNYQGENSEKIIGNIRYALGGSRYNMSPLMMNKYDIHKKYGGTPRTAFEHNYNTPVGVGELLDNLKYLIEQPDLSYVLMKRNIYNRYANGNPEGILAYEPIRFLNKMPAFQRKMTVKGNDAEDIHGLASSDSNRASILLWNKGSEEKSLKLDLKNLDRNLVRNHAKLTVTQIKKKPDEDKVLKQLNIKSVDTTISLSIPANGIITVQAGKEDDSPVLSYAKYARDQTWVPRLGKGKTGAPKGMGHYDKPSDRLIVSVNGSDGVGLAGVTLKDVPKGDHYNITATLSESGLPHSSKNGLLGIRVDYLDGNDSLKTVIYRDSRYRGAFPWNIMKQWQPLATLNTVKQKNRSFQNGTVKMDVGREAPQQWTALNKDNRRIKVSLILQGIDNKASVQASLSDGIENLGGNQGSGNGDN